MGVKIEFLSAWNRNFDTVGAHSRYCLGIDDRPDRFPLFTCHFITRYVYTRTYAYILPTRFERAGARLFTASVRERKSSFPTHQYRLHRYLATLVFSARSKSLFGRGSPLLLPSPSRPSPAPLSLLPFAPRSSVALHRNYTKRPTRDDAGVKREIGRVPRVRRVPPFENCFAILSCVLDWDYRTRYAIVPTENYTLFVFAHCQEENVQLFTNIKN